MVPIVADHTVAAEVIKGGTGTAVGHPPVLMPRLIEVTLLFRLALLSHTTLTVVKIGAEPVADEDDMVP